MTVMGNGHAGACARRRAIRLAVLFVPLLAACAALQPAAAPAVQRYRLALPAPTPVPATAVGPVLVVDPPAAAPGLQGRGMAYVRRPYQIDYFARHGWVDPPARMLEPLLVQALQRQAGFRTVPAGLGVAGDLRLETRILRLQQEFTVHPSRERLALRAWLIDARSGRVLADRVFEALEPAPGNDPYSGVQAANRAVAKVLAQLAAFCRAQVHDRAAVSGVPRAASPATPAHSGPG
jgi:cholesterol transport system auxiliary component